MEELCTAAEQYADILKRCSSAEVKTWEKEDLSRALQWSKYFKEVYTSIAKKRNIVEAFDRSLKAIGRSNAFRCGGSELSAKVLSDGLQYLTKVLIENPDLPQELYEGLKSSCPDDVDKCTAQISRNKLLLGSLWSIHSKLVQCCPDLCTSTDSDGDLLVLVDAKCLQEDLQWCLQSSSPNSAIIRRLDSLARVPKGLETILTTYSQYSTERELGSLILQWILQHLRSLWTKPATVLENHSGWQFGKQCPPHLLAQVSCRSDQFSDLYLIFLSRWADQISRTERLDLTQSAEYQALAGHFQRLAQSSSKLKDACIELVASHFILVPHLNEHNSSVWSLLMSTLTAETLFENPV